MNKIRVKIQVGQGSAEWLRRQLPRSPKHPWNRKYEFIINRKEPECDYFVALFGLPYGMPVHVSCPPKNTICVWAEPQFRSPPRRLLRQFESIWAYFPVDCAENMKVLPAASLTWHIDADYDSLAQLHTRGYAKDSLLSVICSSKDTRTSYRRRIRFVEALREHYGDRIAVYGHGTREIASKWDGLLPYKYTVAMENSIYDDYWTEKLGDALLAGCYPFYSGAPNIAAYFPSDSLTPIDIAHPSKAIDVMERAIAADLHGKRLEAVQCAAGKMQNEYQLFAMLDSHIDSHAGGQCMPRSMVFVNEWRVDWLQRCRNLPGHLAGGLFRTCRNAVRPVKSSLELNRDATRSGAHTR